MTNQINKSRITGRCHPLNVNVYERKQDQLVMLVNGADKNKKQNNTMKNCKPILEIYLNSTFSKKCHFKN